MIVQLFTTNLQRCDLAIVKQLASQGLNIDLSTQTKTLAEPLIVLMRMIHPEMNEQDALKNSHEVQKLFNASFVIVVSLDVVIEMMCKFSDLKFISAESVNHLYICVVDGAFDKWVAVIEEYTNEARSSMELVNVLNEVHKWFMRQGLNALFDVEQSQASFGKIYNLTQRKK